MNRSIAMITAVSLLALTGCTTSARGATRGYTITDFSRIRVQGPFDVRLHLGAAASAKATGPGEALDRLSLEVDDGTLVIKPLPGGWGGWPGMSMGRVVIDVTAPTLDQATLAGSGDVAIDRVRGDALSLVLAGSGDLSVAALDVDRLNATMTGSGDLTMAGRARQGQVTLTGSGDVHGDALAIDDARIKLVGSGDIDLAAQHSAQVDLAGSGDIRVRGPAPCQIMRSGSGDVSCAHQTTGG